MRKSQQVETSIWQTRIDWGWSALPARRRHLYVYVLLFVFALFVRVADDYKQMAKSSQEREKAARLAKMMIYVPAE